MVINGMELIESSVLVINIPKRKHKKKRIQKKWIKRYGYKEIPDPKVYIFEGKMIAHPNVVKKIIKFKWQK